MFEPYIDQNPGTTVLSPQIVAVTPYTINIVSVVNSQDVHLVLNDLPVGSTANVLIGDKLQLSFEAPNELNETAFVTYTIDSVEFSTYLATSLDPGQYLYRFKFVDYTPLLPGDYTSSEFELYRLFKPIRITVADVYSATILKNNIAQGTSCFGNIGDIISLKVTVPDIPGKLISVPLAVGSVVDTLEVFRAFLDQTVNDILFQHNFGASRNTEYTSNEVIVSGLGEAVEANTDGILLLNDIPTSTPCQVVNGDRIRLKVTSSAFDNTAVFGVLWLGPRYFEYAVLTAPIDLYIADQYLNLGLFDLSFIPDNSHNSIGAIQPDNSLITSLLTAPTNTSYGDNQALLLSYFEDRLYIVDPTTLETQKVVQFATGSHPFSITESPGNASLDLSPHVHYISLAGSKKILELNLESYNPEVYFDLSSTPRGITADNNAYVYVAAEDGVYALDTLTGIITQIDSTSDAYEACSLNERVFISFLSKNIVREYSDGAYVRTFQTGLNPLGMCCIGTNLYVCDSADNTITVIDLITNTVTGRIQTLSYPVYCSERDGKLAVVHHGVHTLALINLTTWEIETQIDLPEPPFGVSNNFVCLLYDNNPSRVEELSLPSLDVDPIYDANLSSTVTFILPDLARVRHICLPNITNAKIFVNGNNVGLEAYATPGSLVEVEIPTGSTNGETSIVYVGFNGALQALSVTTSFDTIPTWLEFGGIYNVFRRSTVLSPEVILSGINEGKTVSLTYHHPSDKANFLVNSIPVGKTVNVVLGDVLQLSSEVMGICGETLTYKITSNSLDVGSYEIGTFVVEGPIKDLTNDEVTSQISGKDSEIFKQSEIEIPKLEPIKETFNWCRVDSSQAILEHPSIFTGTLSTPQISEPFSEILAPSKSAIKTIQKELTFDANLGIVDPSQRNLAQGNIGRIESYSEILSLAPEGVVKTLEYKKSSFISSFIIQENPTRSLISQPIATSGKKISESRVNIPVALTQQLGFKIILNPLMPIRYTAALHPKIDERILFIKNEKRRVKTTSFPPFEKYSKYRDKFAYPYYTQLPPPPQKLFHIPFVKRIEDPYSFFVIPFMKNNYTLKWFVRDAAKYSKLTWKYDPKSFKEPPYPVRLTSKPAKKSLPVKPSVFVKTAIVYNGLDKTFDALTTIKASYPTGKSFSSQRFIKTFYYETLVSSPSFIRPEENIKFDFSITRGLYMTSAEAQVAAHEFPDAIIYSLDQYIPTYLEERYLYRTPPDMSIVCLAPLGTVIPIAGYLSGG